MAPTSLPGHLSALLAPAFYPHPTTDIRVIETHISWVILTGEYAYKIKKPVKLPFLDFSELAYRKYFCEEELRLNKRFAPDIYLSLVAFTSTGNDLSLNGGGNVIEYGVKMRQFSSENQLSQLIIHNKINQTQITCLANTIATIHNTLPQAATDSPFSSLGSIAQATLENFSTLEKLLIDKDAQDKLDDIRNWSQHFYENNQALFNERKAQGFIRECHGDLHLGNITLIEQLPVIFDCIEFNEDFRWIDVISDLAFLIMDLYRCQRPEYARNLLNHYLEVTGDYRGLRLLRFYLIYRAMVRCKIEAITAQQQNALDSNKRYQDYLDLALNFMKPRTPRLLITHGLSGSGKSVVGQMLVEESETIRIRSDVERKRLFGLNALDNTNRTEKALVYSTTATQQTYEKLSYLAQEIIAANYSVIIDATFLKLLARTHFRKLALKLAVPFLIISTSAPPQLLRKRLAERQHLGKDASEATLDVLEKQIATQEPLTNEELMSTVIIATDKKIDIATALNAININRY